MFRGIILSGLLLASAVAGAGAPVRSDDVNGKIVAPSMEEHASYFSERRKGIPPADLAKADKLRRKTIDSIKDLLENKKGTRRFELLLRLGELYVERHDYMRDYEMATYVKAWDTWSKETDKSKKGPEPKVDFSGSQNELTKAANSFRQLVNEFPKHPRTDAALYSLAQTLARLGKDTAIEYYKQLIKSHPKSPLIPDTYLSLGEYYFDKHQIPEAIEYYKKVMAFKDHRAYLYAVYKLGWANYNARITRRPSPPSSSSSSCRTRSSRTRSRRPTSTCARSRSGTSSWCGRRPKTSPRRGSISARSASRTPSTRCSSASATSTTSKARTTKPSSSSSVSSKIRPSATATRRCTPSSSSCMIS
jgi:outer membrane protein assembly factor BamD (BamD/ComL family)